MILIIIYVMDYYVQHLLLIQNHLISIDIGLCKNNILECVFNVDCNGENIIVNDKNNDNFFDNRYYYPPPYPTPTPPPLPKPFDFRGIDIGLCENSILECIFGVGLCKNDINDIVMK